MNKPKTKAAPADIVVSIRASPKQFAAFVAFMDDALGEVDKESGGYTNADMAFLRRVRRAFDAGAKSKETK